MSETTLDAQEQAEKQLQKELAVSIREINDSRAVLLKRAQEEDGAEAVNQLNDRYDELRDAYRAVLKKRLDRNNHRYAELMVDAAQEVERLKQSVNSFQATERILEGLSKTVSALGRALIVLG